MNRGLALPLRWKERTENRSALWVGLAVFVLLPTLWTLLLAAIEPRDGVFPGIASLIWVLAGWLFAAVLGAQAVCRDLGTPMERFLLARPVAEAEILKIKVRAGLRVLIGIVIAIGALEFAWWNLAPAHRETRLTEHGAPLIVGSGFVFCAYWLAFSAACFTRRALVSTSAAAFVLVLVVTIPLIVHIPGVSESGGLVFEEIRDETCLVGAGLLLVSGAIALAARRLSVRTGLRVKAGPRQLVWIAALTLVVLFVAAMRQVGASQPLAATWWHSRSYESDYFTQFVVGNQRIGLSTGDRSVCLIDLDDLGRIIQSRRLDRERSAAFLPKPHGVWALDGEGNLAMVRNCVTSFHESEPRSKRVKLEMCTLKWNELVTRSNIALPWPADAECPDGCYVIDAFFSGSRLFALMRCFGNKTDWAVIVAYQISEDRAVALASSTFPIDEPWYMQFQEVWDSANGKPLRKLGLLGQYGDLAYCFDPDAPADTLTASIKRPTLTDRGIVLPQADRWGLWVSVQPGRNTKGEIRWAREDDGAVGRIRASPWATLFRSANPRLLAAGPNRWVELHENNAMVYDLTDPSHPRRIAHISAPPFWHAAVSGDLLVFDHSLGISVAKLPPIEKK
jgi:hypothetical protein